MSNYVAKANQSIFDICLSTYGGFDEIIKLCSDSNITDNSQPSYFNQSFSFDPALVQPLPTFSIPIVVQASTIKIFTGKNNQSIFDVAIQTYGNMDNIVKLCMDSGIDGFADATYFQKLFTYDASLISDSTVSDNVNNNNIIFATGNSIQYVVFSEEDRETIFVSEDGDEEFIPEP